ncbi:MAG: hypothetical protein DRI94_15135 [Bacteroidetes bacterium]|nr:MAG: hypothetical protein DRI94_15135 [Bacteroidota bacterium]
MLNVLIFEPNAGIRNTLKYIFNLKGFNCFFINDINENCENKKFDIVYLGINNKLEIDSINKFNTSEIIVSTDIFAPQLLQSELLILNYNIITKPIYLNKILEIIDRFLDKSNNKNIKVKKPKLSNIQDYQITKKLHEGKFSINYKGRNKNNKKLFIKKLKQTDKNKSLISDFFQEALLDIDSKNTVKIIDFDINNSGIFIIYEYIDGKNLKEIKQIWRYNRKAKQIFWIKITIKLLETLNEIHSKNIYHSDIKPENIIVKFNNKNKIDFNNPNIKLISFGQAIIKESKFIKSNSSFLSVYSPPELILKKNKLINQTSDIYSVGIMLYELLTGEIPFSNCNPLKTIAYQLNKNIPENKKIDKNLFLILQKATYKHVFPKPHTFYNSEQIEKMLILGQEKRYKSVNDFKNNLINYLNNK